MRKSGIGVRKSRVRSACRLLLLLAGVIGGLCGEPSAQKSQEPVIDARKTEHSYHGPGRETDLNRSIDIPVGYFGPSDPNDAEYGDLWLAATLAVEEVNQEGGIEGRTLRLVPAWSDNPWAAGVTDVVRMVYEQEILALISAADGATAHLAEQVVAKARLPLLNPAASDMTANLAHVPWIFSCLPGEDRQVGLLTRAIFSPARPEGFVVVSTVDHDSRVFLDEFTRFLSRSGLSATRQFQIADSSEAGLSFVHDPSIQSAESILIIAPPLESARILTRLREFSRARIFGTSSMGRRPFLEAAGIAAESCVFVLPAATEQLAAFSRKFASRFSREGDFAAAQTYDAVHLLVAGIRQAGLNRARIGDELRQLSGWTGSAGPLIWDATGQNTRPAVLVEIRNGRIQQTEDQTQGDYGGK